MVAMSIMLILLYSLTLSYQNIPVLLFCDDYLKAVYVIDDNSKDIHDTKTDGFNNEWNKGDLVNLKTFPGDRIKFKCHNENGPTHGGGCFLVKDECKCYNFKNLDEIETDFDDSYYYRGEINNIQCEYTGYRLKKKEL